MWQIVLVERTQFVLKLTLCSLFDKLYFKSSKKPLSYNPTTGKN